MYHYKFHTAVTEMGPRVDKLILEFPFTVADTMVDAGSFNVYCARREVAGGEYVVCRASFNPLEEEHQSRDFVAVKCAYPCDANGDRMESGTCVAIELVDSAVCARIVGDMLNNRFIRNDFRVTALHGFCNNPEYSGMVFDEFDGELCPAHDGWDVVHAAGGKLGYGYFDSERKKAEAYAGAPGIKPAEKKDGTGLKPLIFWLHGAGEGGDDPWINIDGCQCSFLSRQEISQFFPEGYYVLAPQCPTVWMDDGEEQLGTSNRSIYVPQVKECLDDFLASHGDIDTSRIYIGGLSNGGFMTMRMIFDYPDLFASALPCCEVFYADNITDEMIESIRHIPTWFVHCKRDELVPPMETSVPTYFRLKEAGHQNLHFSFYEYNEDLTGKYRNEDGSPMRVFNHAIWVNVLNNECHREFDGTNVCVDGVPVTIWEWVSRQRRGDGN